jgi:hypothetical protein
MVCDFKATYGKGGEGDSSAPGMAGGMTGGGHGDSYGASKDIEHITSMSACYGDATGVTQSKKGQKWLLKAYYDYSKYALPFVVMDIDHADP